LVNDIPAGDGINDNLFLQCKRGGMWRKIGEGTGKRAGEEGRGKYEEG
jgi:hypothetical protein